MTWLITRNLALLARRGERLLCIGRERVARVALQELLEAGGGAHLVAHRRARQRRAEEGIGRERAARIGIDEGFECARRFVELARVGERLRVLEREALVAHPRVLVAVAAPVGPELGLGRLVAAQAGGDRRR